MKGRYCPDTAMDDLDGFLCDAGFECPTDQNESNPSDYECDGGYFCGAGLIHKMRCPDGFFADSGETGLEICDTCPEGFYCDNSDVTELDPVECIPDSGCDLGEKRQPICEPGWYEFTNSNGFKSCEYCPDGTFCLAGVEVDYCAAGYICESGINKVPNPSLGECDEGFYCPKGSLGMTRCPFETMSVQTAQRQISDCRGCQPGYVCPWGDYDYYKCPKGHWCPIMGDQLYYDTY